MILLLLVISLLLCWGSFLNVVGHRLITNEDIVFLRSHCPHCKTNLAWYDLIPLFSWIWLRGRCRYCHESISYLYPFIELLTALVGILLLICVPAPYWLAYGIFFSALIVSIRTDLEHMLISQYMNIYLIPFSMLACYAGLLPLALSESILGALCGYGFLSLIGYVFGAITGKEGIGGGDLDMLAFIGACTGLTGCWLSLTIGSLLGSIIGVTYLIATGQQQSTRIPFGPFLAAGAIIYVLCQCEILSYLSF
jgi:leader peptidase (prepilin peptidase) / N-methyltransferase